MPKKLSQLDEAEFVVELHKTYKEARKALGDWRDEAREMYRFEAGHQWSDEDLQLLMEQNRPPVTFNRVSKVIDAVAGTEVTNRMEVKYLPRTNEDGFASEVRNVISKWARDNCNAEDEDSDAFRDTLVCGMGWTETRMDYDENPDGEVCVERVDPLEMLWDPSSKRKNLADSRFIIREKWWHKDDIEAAWPGKDIVPTAEALWADTDGLEPHDADNAWRYQSDTTGYNKKTNEFRILEIQWFEYENFWRGVDPQTGEIRELEKAEVDLAEAAGIPVVKQQRKKFHRAFVAGSTLLEREENAHPFSFTYKCITGKRDTKDGQVVWYGLMRVMRDPQMWANKFFSQILHVINSNAKGGIFWETGAIAHPERATNDMARPESMVELNPGGLGKIKERGMFQFPASIDRMMEFSVASIPDVTGVNLEFMGLTNREQAGVLERQRQQQAMGLLSVLFDSLRLYRKQQGRLLMYFLETRIDQRRLARIVGPELEQYIETVQEDVDNYDIIVDQSLATPNAKNEVWSVLSQVLPVLQQSGIYAAPELIDYLPLPESVTSKWKERIQDPQMQALHQQYEQQIQELTKQLEEQKLKAAERAENIALKQADMQLDEQFRRDQMDVDAALKTRDQDIKLRIAEEKKEATGQSR